MKVDRDFPAFSVNQVTRWITWTAVGIWLLSGVVNWGAALYAFRECIK